MSHYCIGSSYRGQAATNLGPCRGLYANERPMVSCAILLASSRQGIVSVQAYLMPVVLEMELWCKMVKAGRKEGMEVPARLRMC